MKWIKMIWVFTFLVSCNLVEPESQSNLVSQSFIKPGPLDSIEFSISFFDEEDGDIIPVPDFVGEVIVFGSNTKSFRLFHRTGIFFQVNNSGLIISPGDSIIVMGNWKKYELLANTIVPKRPENIKLTPIFFKLNIATEGELINLVWEKEEEAFLTARIQNGKSVTSFPITFIESWPEGKIFLSNQKPENDGLIRIHPWDFKGTGNYPVIIYWFDRSTSELYNNPIQSGIFSPGHGMVHGLGYLHSFDSDTFSVQVSF